MATSCDVHPPPQRISYFLAMEQTVSEREELVREMERYLEQIAQGGDAAPSWSAAAVSPVKRTRRKVILLGLLTRLVQEKIALFKR